MTKSIKKLYSQQSPIPEKFKNILAEHFTRINDPSYLAQCQMKMEQEIALIKLRNVLELISGVEPDMTPYKSLSAKQLDYERELIMQCERDKRPQYSAKELFKILSEYQSEPS